MMQQTGLGLASGQHHPQCGPSQAVAQAISMVERLPPPDFGHSNSCQANPIWQTPILTKDDPHTGSAL